MHKKYFPEVDVNQKVHPHKLLTKSIPWVSLIFKSAMTEVPISYRNQSIDLWSKFGAHWFGFCIRTTFMKELIQVGKFILFFVYLKFFSQPFSYLIMSQRKCSRIKKFLFSLFQIPEYNFITTSKILMRLDVFIFWNFSALKCSYFVLIFYETFSAVNGENYSWR